LRQRIGIARALYNKRNIIVLDEATSALDNQTQDEIIRNIGKIDKDITLIVIAHRPSALRCCSKIFKVENCKIQKLKG
jgi:ATP-binding cassette subfamily B protein